MENVSDDNIKKLRLLVDELDTIESHTDEYKKTLYSIKGLINQELKLISTLTRTDNKIKHYENICAGILGMIATKI
jgi:hypothetical protein